MGDRAECTGAVSGGVSGVWGWVAVGGRAVGGLARSLGLGVMAVEPVDWSSFLDADLFYAFSIHRKFQPAGLGPLLSYLARKLNSEPSIVPVPQYSMQNLIPQS